MISTVIIKHKMTTNFLEIDYDTTDIVETVKSFLLGAQWNWIPYMTVATNFNDESKKIINSSNLLKMLEEKFDGVLKLYKIPAKSVYRWHKDAHVAASLNMVFENYNCHTLFSTDFQHNNIFSVEELIYKPCKFYLFNSQSLHTVINLDSRDRILVTFIFQKPNSYEEIKHWFETEYKNIK